MTDPVKRLLFRNLYQVPPMRYRYVQAETGQTFDNLPNLQALKSAVARHRKSRNIPIGTDFEAELMDWMCRHMPDSDVFCYEQGRSPSEHGPRPIRHAGTGYDGREKWQELHLYALIERPGTVERVAWLENFKSSLPCGECRHGWKKLTRAFPLPQSAPPSDFFAWTVMLHNKVNEKLGKPQISLEEARKFWTQ